ncbi:hypothetical protein [Streptomyces mutabilis]|uniref:Uncharacterized protein n=1 Tax=Streptomyces mutabilis TaxID=67332 RepID=A0A086MR01_9ACTN|nr:hypothetical protein [Streptomyces mutabilis]KFG71319.1 hypothetical protein FM21_33955 [Streptomyces mutabilis]
MRTVAEARRRAEHERTRAATPADHAYAQGWRDAVDILPEGVDLLRQVLIQTSAAASDSPLEQAHMHGMRLAAEWIIEK